MRRRRRAGDEAWRHRNTTGTAVSDSSHGRPSLTIPAFKFDRTNLALSCRARLTRTVTSPATVLIHFSTWPLTFPESLRNRVISGAEAR